MPEVSGNTKVAVAVAATGVGLYLLAKGSKRATLRAARRAAAPVFEYHLAVHLDTGSGGWALVKHAKAGSLDKLRTAVAQVLGLTDKDADGLQLYPVQRGAGGRCTSLEGSLADLANLEALLACLPPEQLQVVELLCTRAGAGAPMPSAVPDSAPTFPLPGASLPYVGTTYHLLGPEPVPHYNLANNVFPAHAAKYPYGSTVRSYSGGVKSNIGDFPTGTVFHPDAETMTTWSADAEIAAELISRSADFPKLWNRPAQIALQDFTGNGLFTSSETSEDWQVGHSLLPRGFNQIKVKSYAPQIMAKTRAFVREWSAFPAGHRLEGVNDWLTAMTADAVVACSMGLDMQNVERLGSKQPPHPFIDAFRFGLGYSGQTITAKSEYGLKRFLPGFGAAAKMEARYRESKASMEKQVEQLVEGTRSGDIGGQNSVIRSMLEDKAGNGKHVRYGVMYAHVANLMIAGHETTAATLGFTLQLLAENPICEARALEEVRRVLGRKTEPCAEDVPQLQYVEQCFREALRLYSPVTNISRDAAYDTLLGGRRVFQGERVSVVTRALHTNPEYWGGEFGDPLSFNPERFAPAAVQSRHPNAYHPWGFGTRACIGSQFALFEAKTFLASLLIHFRLEGIPGYQLRAGFHAGGAAPSAENLAFVLYPRAGGPLWTDSGAMRSLPPLLPELKAAATVATPAPSTAAEAASATEKASGYATGSTGGPVMRVLYGSNCGACNEFALQVAAAAGKCGFQAAASSLDSAVIEEQQGLMVPDGSLLVVVTSTYNGQPPDNAVSFKKWLLQQADGSLSKGGLRYAVFGVGNSQWHTYQQFPRELDAGLQRCGAERISELGACDVDGASFESDFDSWLARLLQAVGGGATPSAADGDLEEALDGVEEFILEEVAGSQPLLSDIGTAIQALYRGTDAAFKMLGIDGNLYRSVRKVCLEVAEDSHELCQKSSARSVRHVTLKLPKGYSEYRAGDHLEILPPNEPVLVAWALDAIGVSPEAVVTWDPSKTSRRSRSMDNGIADQVWSKVPAMRVPACLVLEWVPDLASPPSRKVCASLARRAVSAGAKEELMLLGMDSEVYKQRVAGPSLSLAELLQRYKGQLNMSLGQLVALAKPLAPMLGHCDSRPSGVHHRYWPCPQRAGLDMPRQPAEGRRHPWLREKR
eukprot:CAMPEP_0115155730 /NCGR_PEP_ID=MMETSP0227-20121206/68055_1 /TAXON_ID=89957 /ORGANISM="Polarella glacialis, Strain CCMP 1383" /LENGTH=1158 /DNA_ID=CAMNT_0002566835 /DNA_START=113 /DNA_END=3586 /DNA_ORIENTATION=+